jgi:hypothetical protein
MPSAAVTALKKASKGLLFPSESDEPFAAFTWGKADGKLTPDKVRKLAKHDADDPVEEVSPADLFKDLTEEQDWHGKKEKAQVKKFRDLEQTLRDQLADVKVFRVGETNIDIYIVGKTPEGEWAGLETRAVET